MRLFLVEYVRSSKQQPILSWATAAIVHHTHKESISVFQRDCLFSFAVSVLFTLHPLRQSHLLLPNRIKEGLSCHVQIRLLSSYSL